MVRTKNQELRIKKPRTKIGTRNQVRGVLALYIRREQDMSTDRDVERLSAVVLNSLDDQGSSGTLARRAYASRTQFFRIFKAVIDETPAAMRRRLLLERDARLARLPAPPWCIVPPVRTGPERSSHSPCR